ncbi:MAG: C4-type zinc ribbon domain-containing protein [Bdellovibrionota bacterium]
MNPTYETIEQIYRLDIDAGLVTQHQRAAQKELAELSKKSRLSEELLGKSRNEMSFNEAELRRLYKRLDELEEKKVERSAKLAAAKNDDDHRAYKRELDNVDRDMRETQRRADDTESKIEQSKTIFHKAESDLKQTIEASEDERKKAETAEGNSAGRLAEIQTVRDSYLSRLDDRVAQHYTRVAKITRNPNGPICRVVEGACGNCRIGLSPQILNTVNRGKAVEFCPSCSHLLLPSSQN